MVAPMPEHFKKNFIYRHCYNNVWQRDMNATFVIVGTPGKGKSTLGLKIAEDLDKTFTVDRVCYSVQDMVALLAKRTQTGKAALKPGSVVLFDEIVNDSGSYSRTALSKHNQIMNFVIANMRARRIILIICLPKFTQLDKDIREVGLTGVFQMITIDRVRQRSKAKFKWRNADEITGNMIDPFPRLVDPNSKEKFKITRVWFGKPSKELENAYKKKKFEYMINSAEKWLSMLTNKDGSKKLVHARDIAKEIAANPEKFKTDGKLDYIKVLANYEVGDQKARNIVKTAELLTQKA
jgi:adenylate kinase family enzyme